MRKPGRDRDRPPTLNPRLTPRQLHDMAVDLSWRPWLHLIASHPNAWPELRRWYEAGRIHGFETLPVPDPPDVQDAPMERFRASILAPRIPAAPLPPERPTARDDVPETAASPAGTGHDGHDAPATAAEPAEPSPDVPDTAPEPPDGHARDVLSGLMSVAGPERRRAPSVRRVVAVCLTASAVAAIAALAVFALIRLHRNASADAFRQATESCEQAYAWAVARRDGFETMLEKARSTSDGTDPATVSDESVLDDLLALLDESGPGLMQCPADGSVDGIDAVAAGLDEAAAWYEGQEESLSAAVDAVNGSVVEKRLADARDALSSTLERARELLSSSEGNVQDEATRTALSTAVDAARKLLDAGDDAQGMADASASLDQAMAAVNDSVKAKQDADAQAAAEAAAAQAAQQAQQSYSGGGYGYGYSPDGSASSGPSSGGTGSSGQSGGGWSVPAPVSPDPFTPTDPTL